VGFGPCKARGCQGGAIVGLLLNDGERYIYYHATVCHGKIGGEQSSAVSSGSVLVIGYDSWVTQIRVSGGFSIGAFLNMQRRHVIDE
jgi:hypothetical protein